jgi:HAD superfamily hydrolase (TIGR01509 family)
VPSALIFDFDGLILDTEGPDFISWKEAWEQHGATLTLMEWAQCIGTAGAFDPYVRLEQAVGTQLDRQAVGEARRARYSELLSLQQLSPGVLSCLDSADALGIPTAIASSSTRSWVEEHLRRFDLLERFRVIGGRDDAGSPKPSPAVYEYVLARLEVGAGGAVSFEDSPNGVAAAKAAGVYCVAVPCSVTAELDLSQADLCLQSLADVSLGDVLARLAK